MHVSSEVTTLTTGREVQAMLGLRAQPIAVGFLDSPPANLTRWSGPPTPAGCTFWQRAMAGSSFYTEPADHYNCSVGSYTHGIELPPERAHELGATLSFMEQSNYVAMAEVPGIPRLAKAPAYVAYAPVDDAEFTPDVVLIAATAAQGMLIYEAALKAGAGDALTTTLGRPGCAVLPLTVNTGAAALSFGCVGNRTFTGLPDQELYLALPGARWPAVAQKLGEVQRANASMQEHYLAHREKVAGR